MYVSIFPLCTSGYAIGAGAFGTDRVSPYPLVAMGAPGFANNEGTIGAVSIILLKINDCIH